MRQNLLDTVAVSFIFLGKFQLLAQVGRIFVHRKSWWIGGDLEEHTARRTEVDRVEILPVDNRSDLLARGREARTPCQLLVLIPRAEGDMMDCPGTGASDGTGVRGHQVHG